MPSRTIRGFPIVAAALMLSAVPSDAQTRAKTFGVIDGTVVDTAGHGIAGVDVFIIDEHRMVRTSAGGGYRIDSVSAGPHLLRYRRVGFMPITLPARVAADDVFGVDVVLKTFMNVLPTVIVQGANGDPVALPVGFAERMRKGQGTYLTEVDIAKLHPANTSDLMRTMAGLNVATVGASDGRAGSTRRLYSGRGRTSIFSSDDCGASPIQLYIDGVQLLDSDLDLVSPNSIAGIEVYKSGATAPSRIVGTEAKCGAVLIWTKN